MKTHVSAAFAGQARASHLAFALGAFTMASDSGHDHEEKQIKEEVEGKIRDERDEVI